MTNRDEMNLINSRLKSIENILKANGLYGKFGVAELRTPNKEKFKKIAVIKCPQCEHIDDYYVDDNQDFVKCTNCIIMVAVDGNIVSEWKDLDNNVKIEVLYSDKYQIERSLNNKWVRCLPNPESILLIMIENPSNGLFRYRLKPIEVCKITKNMAIELLGKQVVDGMGTDWFIRDGHKVEIIE